MHPATRCAECHGPIAKEWKTSTHARADVSPVYLAMRSQGEHEACDRCHAPLVARAEPNSLAARDAVGCDSCHAIREVDSPGTLALHLDDIVKYGPLCDTKDNYFHKVGCSPLHGTSELCSACHSLSQRTSAGQMLTVQSEFEEWRASIYSGARVECQSCHMPGAHDAVAVGSPTRGGVPNHAFAMADLRKNAVSMGVSVRDAGKDLAVSVSLKNNRAGHSVPSGLPERRMALRIAIHDDAGHVGRTAEQVYGRMLVNDQGPAPFYAATRLALDSRIAAMETRQEEFTLEAQGKGEVEVALVFVDIAADIAKGLGVDSQEEVITRVLVPFGPRGPSGSRPRLPKTVEP